MARTTGTQQQNGAPFETPMYKKERQTRTYLDKRIRERDERSGSVMDLSLELEQPMTDTNGE